MCAWGNASPLPTQPQEDRARVVVGQLPPGMRVINAPQHLAPGRLVFDKPARSSRIGRSPGRRRLQQAGNTQTERNCTASSAQQRLEESPPSEEPPLCVFVCLIVCLFDCLLACLLVCFLLAFLFVTQTLSVTSTAEHGE